STFLITDWFNHTPKEVLAKNFGVAESSFADLPRDIDHTRYMFPVPVPGPLSSDRVPNPAGQRTFSYHLLAQEPVKTSGGMVRILEMFKSPRFADVSLNQWMALTPPELVQAHLNLTPTMMGALRKQKRPVV